MGMFDNMKTEGLEEAEDRLGGFSLLQTDLYPAKLKHVYITKADSGAMAANIIADINGKEYREIGLYFTNKAGENFYLTEDKKKSQLPGFVIVNALCVAALQKELSELDTEDKTVKVWDSKEKKEVNKSLPCIVELHGAEVLLAIIEETVNKSEKNDNGGYTDIADSRDQNRIQHVMHLETGATVSEMRAAMKAEAEGKPVPEFTFGKQWQEKYQGKKADNRKIKDGQAGAPKSGRPQAAPAAGAAKATSSLFNRGS